MTWRVHRGAEADLIEAARFYRQEGGAELARRFLDEFERVAKLLVDFPGLGTPTNDGRRVHPLRDFPHSVIYRPDDAGLRILVVRSQHRDPAHGESRF